MARAALLARHWPAQGERNSAALALGGFLLGSGWQVDEASEFIRVVAEQAGDEEAKQRAETVGYTASKRDAGEPTTGLPSLAKIFGPKIESKLPPWLALTQKRHSDGTDQLIEKLNTRHAVVMVGGKCAVLNESVDPVLGSPEITLSSPTDFRTFYANHTVFAGEKSVRLGAH